MAYDRPQAAESAHFLRKRLAGSPEIGILAGTGLGESAGAMKAAARMDYAEIPHFPLSTVTGHAGRLLFGEMAERAVLVFQGRFHLYEGYPPRAVVFPVRVMQELGVKFLIVTNAAGGLNPAFRPGDLMLITDHVNLTGDNPLVGGNDPRWGERFPDMSRTYDPELRHAARTWAARSRIPCREGVYAGLKGPSLETPAEIRFLRTIGCDAVGMSTVQEVIAAVHAGMRVLGVSVITNVHDPDRPRRITVEAVLEVAGQAMPGLADLILGVIRTLPAKE